jgi:mannitol/fructose-specific phosphotransferase system IIA component (Ntr-type)
MPSNGRPLLDLGPYTDPARVRFLAPGLGKASALRELAQATAAHPSVGDLPGFIAAILERERVSATGIGSGIAVPHAKLSSVTGFVITLGIARDGIDFQARDGMPVQILVMIAASDRTPEDYLKLLATVAGRLKAPQVRSGMLDAADPEAVVAAFVGR